MKPWELDPKPKMRHGQVYIWHYCMDCLKPIRWESLRCYEDHKKHLKANEEESLTCGKHGVAKHQEPHKDFETKLACHMCQLEKLEARRMNGHAL